MQWTHHQFDKQLSMCWLPEAHAVVFYNNTDFFFFFFLQFYIFLVINKQSVESLCRQNAQKERALKTQSMIQIPTKCVTPTHTKKRLLKKKYLYIYIKQHKLF